MGAWVMDVLSWDLSVLNQTQTHIQAGLGGRILVFRLFLRVLRVGCALTEELKALNSAHLLTQESAGHISGGAESSSTLGVTLLPHLP